MVLEEPGVVLPWWEMIPSELLSFALFVLAVTIALAISTLPWSGSTPGGHVAKIAMIRSESSQRPSLIQSFLLGIGAGFGGLCFFCGPLYAFWLHPAHRGTGSLLARVIPIDRANKVGE